MSYVLHLAGGVDGLERYPELYEQVGRYVVRYEPELAKKDEQWLWTSDDVNDAKEFASFGDAHDYWRRAIGIRPWDGQPDRPLTVYHVMVMQKGAEVIV